jgi:F-type H+-transporting ATPase subunit b
MEELLHNLGINGKLLFAQAVNFLLVLFLLQKFVFKKLLQGLEHRKERIVKGLDLTDKAEREIERIDQARTRELHAVKQQGEELLAQTKTEAASKRRELLLQTRKEAETMLIQGKQDAQRQKEDAIKAATQEIQLKALLFAEKVLQRSFTKADQERLAKEVLGTIDTNHA